MQRRLGQGLLNHPALTLGAYPEVTEEESQPNQLPNRNDSIETAEPVRSTPVVVNGTLREAAQPEQALLQLVQIFFKVTFH